MSWYRVNKCDCLSNWRVPSSTWSNVSHDSVMRDIFSLTFLVNVSRALLAICVLLKLSPLSLALLDSMQQLARPLAPFVQLVHSARFMLVLPLLVQLAHTPNKQQLPVLLVQPAILVTQTLLLTPFSAPSEIIKLRLVQAPATPVLQDKNA